MKKKVLTVLLTGAMVASMAAGATVVSAEDNDNTLTVWAWDPVSYTHLDVYKRQVLTLVPKLRFMRLWVILQRKVMQLS